jgi:hypothetical protein
MRSFKVVAAVGLAVIIIVVIAKLAAAPLYARYDERQCRAAYADARTRQDTVAVDLHPYASRRKSRNARCGEVRTVAVVSDSVLLADTICLAGRIGLPCRP